MFDITENFLFPIISHIPYKIRIYNSNKKKGNLSKRGWILKNIPVRALKTNMPKTPKTAPRM
jgi:hypothetical protein